MYSVTKRIDFCYGHRLLDYDGICKHPHGHNAVAEIEVRTGTLDNRNMEALQRAVDSAPDIILMDLSLPVMDGWEATRRLKADKRTASIPVVALTGHALAGISESVKRAGCVAFVTKPCLPEDLVKEIRRILDSPNTKKVRRSGKYAKTVN